jgi:hypothetical protein
LAVRELSKIAYQPFLTRRDTCIELPTQHACCVWVANTYRTTVCATPRAARVPSNARINHVNMCNCFRGANSKPPHTSSYRETVCKTFCLRFLFLFALFAGLCHPGDSKLTPRLKSLVFYHRLQVKPVTLSVEAACRAPRFVRQSAKCEMDFETFVGD